MADWNSLETVRKGTYGETLVTSWLISRRKGLVPAMPHRDAGAHIFDMLLMIDKQNICILDVKTKPRRLHYPDTGLNTCSLNEYLFISKKHNLGVFLFFVDELIGGIYFQRLEKLLQPLAIEWRGKLINYPYQHGNQTYFFLGNLLKGYTQKTFEYARNLSAEEIETLKCFQTERG